MVTEYEHWEHHGNPYVVGPGSFVAVAMWRGTNVAQSNCKTAAWTLQILSPGARSPKGREANDSSTRGALARGDARLARARCRVGVT